jgi:hypothetical protein
MSDTEKVIDLASSLILGAMMGLDRARQASDIIRANEAAGRKTTVADINHLLDEGDAKLLALED